MASSINADNGVVSGSAGLKSSADSTGVLALQTNGTTAVTVDASQAVSFTNAPTVTGGTANGVAFLNGSKVLTTGTALVFDGSQFSVLRSSTSTTLFDDAEIRAINTGAATINQRVDIAMRFQDGTYNGTGGVSMVRESATARSGALSLSPIDSSGNAINGMRINSTGAVSLFGASTSANGVGITFPATQSASTNANTLDDYEEGSWTPAITNATTYGGNNNGRYIKVGRLVTLIGNLHITAFNNAGATTQQISAFPFTISNTSENYPQMIFFQVDGCNQTNLHWKGQGTPNTTKVELYTVSPSTGINYTQILSNTFGTVVVIEFSITYFADA